jgi:hypothetical protein
MKKHLITLLLITLPLTVFAADFSLSAGGGVFSGYTFTRYTLEGNDNINQHVLLTQNMDRVNYGAFAFFDFTYGIFSVAFQSANNSYSEIMTIAGERIPNTDQIGTGSEMSINLSLMGKYPFKLNDSLSLFPMLGIEYQIALRQRRHPDGELYNYDRTKGEWITDRDKDGNPFPLSAWNAIMINIGVGLDYFFTGNMFLRSKVIMGFRLPTGYELGALEVIKNPPTNIVTEPKLGGINGTPTLKIALGYRF